MSRSLVPLLALGVGVCFGALGLTGSGESGVGVLETVPPVLVSVGAVSEGSLQVVFSEPMLGGGVSVPFNYGISGSGVGTLDVHPSHMAGTGPYVLVWDSGEMLNGATIAVMAAGVQDLVGNPIDPTGNMAWGSGLGVAPSFGNLAVVPSRARRGDRVALAFTVSEPLDGVPTVTVNNHAAVFVSVGKATECVYEYVVQGADMLGIAEVSITGSDLAGNVGTFHDDATLEVVDVTAELPLRVWPAGVVLFVLGLLLFARQRNGREVVLLVLVTAIFAPSAAWGDGPAVSNVTFTQAPDGAGTKVDIGYDLVAPNGPCGISVWLSKNGGTDGYVYPAASISGDVAGVSTGTGYHIVWDVAADYPRETITQARIRVTADDSGIVPGLPVEMVAVSDGAFRMGRSSDGDDATYGQADEWPSREVTLSGYQVGKYEVTNQQYCDVLNWAVDGARNYLLTEAGAVWTGTGDIYAGAEHEMILAITHGDCNIQYLGGRFWAKTRTGLPLTTVYSMAGHPVVAVSWYGAVAFCNWLSEMDGLTPCYDMAAAGWPLTLPPPLPGGYRLPTEAEWERAAAWDTGASKHWIYGMMSDTLAGQSQANYDDGTPGLVNPFGLTAEPFTAPGGWFDGVNESPNGGIATANARSSAGCCDLSGNVAEWCHDWYGAYEAGAPTNPVGPNTGTARVLRGGSWHTPASSCRTACRASAAPTTADYGSGFRLARTVAPAALAMVDVSAGTFMMGNSGVGDDAADGELDEAPAHSVALSAYRIGKYEVTNQQYCDVLNWANRPSRHYLRDNANEVWTGTGDLYAGGVLQSLLLITREECGIQYADGVFTVKTKTGLPGTTFYSMASHPVLRVTWYGCAAFCNWLSEMEGLQPCYDMTNTGWPLVGGPSATEGYRLPTEAEWERAAGWDAGLSKHWIYSLMSDTLVGASRVNYAEEGPTYVNPLGLTATPFTSPVGWFDGVHVSPNGTIATVDSPSPVGCYDMSGNAYEWCHDWYLDTYYSGGAMTNPAGPATGTRRVGRGGSWYYYRADCRSAMRVSYPPSGANENFGFRVVRSQGTGSR